MSGKIVTCLWFDHGEARTAAESYAATFPDSHVGQALQAASDYPGGKQGGELTVEFTVLGQAFVGLNGGSESQCDWCKDRWGFSWQIVPRALIAALKDPDRAAAKRAMDALMTMRRIDIAEIEAARAGSAAAWRPWPPPRSKERRRSDPMWVARVSAFRNSRLTAELLAWARLRLSAFGEKLHCDRTFRPGTSCPKSAGSVSSCHLNGLSKSAIHSGSV